MIAISRLRGGCGRIAKRIPRTQLRLWQESSEAKQSALWQRRFYDFNVWSRKKKIEKLAYMHMNPVKRGLVARPDHWIWSSCQFYEGQKESRIRIDPAE